jgi:hypothetical protein
MPKKTGNKYKTEKCGRCGNSHNGYSGKLNRFKEEYVVCYYTNKPMSINSDSPTWNSFAFKTIWELEN